MKKFFKLAGKNRLCGSPDSCSSAFAEERLLRSASGVALSPCALSTSVSSGLVVADAMRGTLFIARLKIRSLSKFRNCRMYSVVLGPLSA